MLTRLEMDSVLYYKVLESTRTTFGLEQRLFLAFKDHTWRIEWVRESELDNLRERTLYRNWPV